MNAVEMKGITKQYPLVRALDQVDFVLKKGEIHSLLGENGAGKSTLMKVLYGMCKPDAGEIKVMGNTAAIKNSKQAIELGIGMVHQHFMLTPVMTVMENIIIGQEPVKGIFLDEAKAHEEVEALIAKYNFQISSVEKVENLSVGEQQRVEILKAIYHGAEILILDEPTAVLTPQEVVELFTIMRELKKQGKSIVIITHKLKETLEIADSMSVLRDGCLIESSVPVGNAKEDDLARMMVGRDVSLGIVRRTNGRKEACLEAKGLGLHRRGKDVLKGISLTLYKGEILGLAGIEGNGQSELIDVLTGCQAPDQGTVAKEGKCLKGNARDFMEEGIGHIPEDRMTQGLILERSIADNIILGYERREKFSHKGILKKKEINTYSARLVQDFRIKAPDADVLCNALSGGNQQKVVLARVFSEDPDALIVAHPTRGVDIGAMEYIHNRLLDLRDEGKAILLISADLDEVKCLSDRMAVLYDGQIVAEGRPEDFEDSTLGLLMTSGKQGGIE